MSKQPTSEIYASTSRVQGPKSNAPRYRDHKVAKANLSFSLPMESLLFNKFLLYKPIGIVC